MPTTVPPDYERWMRNLLDGIKSVRRWKNKDVLSKYGFFGNKLNWLRAYILAPFFLFFAGLFGRVARFFDPWNATPENVLEHSFKQAMIIQKMLAIEIYNGNQHRLDCYRLLQYAINHDLAESVVGDINFNEKAKNKAYLDAKEYEAYFKIMVDGVGYIYYLHFAFPRDSDELRGQAEMELWNVSEHVGYCYFMLEEIVSGRISLKEKIDFYFGVLDKLIPLLRKYENKFVSVKEILNKELLPKLRLASNFF